MLKILNQAKDKIRSNKKIFRLEIDYYNYKAHFEMKVKGKPTKRVYKKINIKLTSKLNSGNQ